jgi:hypothetical protein
MAGGRISGVWEGADEVEELWRSDSLGRCCHLLNRQSIAYNLSI